MIQCQLLRAGARAPMRATPGSAAFDLHFCPSSGYALNVVSETILETGIALQIMPGWCGLILPRSGLSSHLEILNAPGLIDPDYRGEVKVKVAPRRCARGMYHEVLVRPGDRIAQLLLIGAPAARSDVYREIEVVESLSDTERGKGGFGSTGR